MSMYCDRLRCYVGPAICKACLVDPCEKSLESKYIPEKRPESIDFVPCRVLKTLTSWRVVHFPNMENYLESFDWLKGDPIDPKKLTLSRPTRKRKKPLTEAI